MRRTTNLLPIVSVLVLLAGCAYTKISVPLTLPDGQIVMAEYVSTRDSDISGLHIEMLPDGTFKADLEGASGQASPVVQAYGAVMAAGIRSLAEGAVSGAVPGP